jgi:hypothetical protein
VRKMMKCHNDMRRGGNGRGGGGGRDVTDQGVGFGEDGSLIRGHGGGAMRGNCHAATEGNTTCKSSSFPIALPPRALPSASTPT